MDAPETEEEIRARVRIPKKRDREVLGTVEGMMGANHIMVRCMDGVTRMGRIPGKMRKRIWVRQGDVVIMRPWAFEDGKADVVWRYTQPQVDWLRRNGFMSS